MKIDLSSIFLMIIVVIPGLFAQRSKGLIVPLPMIDKGASEELAELVALGLATHGILVFAFATILLFTEWIRQLGWLYFFNSIDSRHVAQWSNFHPSETILLGFGYIFLSFFASHWLGLVYGIFTLNGGLTARLLNRATWLQRLGVSGLLGQKPIIYELLNPELNDDGSVKKIFVEAELKNGLGFYSGQISQFAIVRDEEPHKPIYLIDPYYKKEKTDAFTPLFVDGVLLDLDGVATLLIRQDIA